MQPNEPTQHPIDYLDQISTAPKKPSPADRLLPIVLIAGILTALVVGILTLLGGDSGKNDLMRLAIRLETIQSISDSSQKTIKSSNLRSSNTNLSIFLTNTNRDLKPHLAAGGIDMSKPDPKIVAQESGQELRKRLEDARLNAAFDRTYAMEMSYELETLSALLAQIEKDSRNRSLREFIATTKSQLSPLNDQFAEFTTTSN